MPELRKWLEANTADILCLQETHLRVGVQCRVPGYTVVRKDRPVVKDKQNYNVGGGLCFLLRNGLSYVELDSPKSIEAHVTQVRAATGNIKIANVYLPPSWGGLSSDELKAFEDLLLPGSCMVVGDLNARNRLW